MDLLICILGKKKVKRRNLETFCLSQMIMSLIVMRWVWREHSDHNWTPCIAAGDFCFVVWILEKSVWHVIRSNFLEWNIWAEVSESCLSWGHILFCVTLHVILSNFEGWTQWFWQGGPDTGRPWRWWWGRPPAAIGEVKKANVGATTLPSIARKFSWQLVEL